MGIRHTIYDFYEFNMMTASPPNLEIYYYYCRPVRNNDYYTIVAPFTC